MEEFRGKRETEDEGERRQGERKLQVEQWREAEGGKEGGGVRKCNP